MGGMNETPAGNRIRIAFFGRRNAGKSTLVNAFTGQRLAIVSDVPGTTTDPVSKAMEILPLGACLITDTAGLDDEGELGAMRVEKSLAVLAAADIAVWVDDGRAAAADGIEKRFLDECRRRNVAVFRFSRGDDVQELKRKIAAAKTECAAPALLDDLASAGDRIVLVCPIDESAPRGRLILPQQQVIRECLDLHAVCSVCQPSELAAVLASLPPDPLVVTDSQAFGEVRGVLAERAPGARLTSFSILFARQKGDLKVFLEGLAAVRNLHDGDTVLIAEGCTHHRQCNDIGTVKIPKAVERLSGRKLKFVFASGGDFLPGDGTRFKLIVHCGGCMLTRREVLRRIEAARALGSAVVNYGILLAAAGGMDSIAENGLVSPEGRQGCN